MMELCTVDARAVVNAEAGLPLLSKWRDGWYDCPAGPQHTVDRTHPRPDTLSILSAFSMGDDEKAVMWLGLYFLLLK